MTQENQSEPDAVLYVGFQLSLSTFHDDGTAVIEHWMQLTQDRVDNVHRLMGPPTHTTLVAQSELFKLHQETDALTVEEPPGPEPEPHPRFDRDDLVPFDPAKGTHTWVVQLWTPIAPEQLEAAARGEPIGLGQAARVSHIFCAYCRLSYMEAQGTVCTGVDQNTG